jgi:hypothetical protein
VIVLDTGDRSRTVDVQAVLVAGYTGRDRDEVQHHIDELAAIGIPPPDRFPTYWALPPWLLSQDPSIVVAGDRTSGEAELCLVADGDHLLVTLASDHTDRAAEAVDIGLSKAICPVPIARQAWPAAAVDGHWDDLVLRSWITDADGAEATYQEGSCASLVPALELLAGVPFRRPQRFALLTGTVPVLGGIRPSASFRAELHDPVRGRSIALAYTTTDLTSALAAAEHEGSPV